MAKKRRKKLIEKTDGLGPHEKKKIRAALRLVWHRCHARRLVVLRATGSDGFPVCEGCGERVPKIAVDHIRPVGEVDEGFINRLFVASDRMQALCNMCHRLKTAAQKKAKQKKRK